MAFPVAIRANTGDPFVRIFLMRVALLNVDLGLLHRSLCILMMILMLGDMCVMHASIGIIIQKKSTLHMVLFLRRQLKPSGNCGIDDAMSLIFLRMWSY